MPNIKLKSYQDDTTLFEGEFETVKDCMEHALLKGHTLKDVALKYNDFSNANFDEGRFQNVDFTASNLTGANMSYGVFENCKFSGCPLYNVCFSFSRFINCTFEDASFGGTDILEAVFEDCVFSTLSCFSLDFTQSCSMAGCYFKSRQARHYPMTRAPIVIKGLEPGTIIFLDQHIKIGAQFFTAGSWTDAFLRQQSQVVNINQT